MKKKAKKITSVVLVLAVMLGAFATIFSLSTSAAVSKAGTYDWYDENEEHYIYYFAMPENWDDIKYGKGLYGGAGIYWDEGTGACGPDAEGPNWPGYSTITEKYWVAMTDPKQRRPHDRDLYYSFVPKDVPSIIWNNYLDGSEITDVPASSFVFKTPRISVGANGYHEGDCSYYDSLDGFWDFVNDAWENNKDLLGRNAECFEEGSNGLTMTFNHMVYVIQEDITPDGGNSQIFKGEWYFLYGNDYYGSWPTAEMAQEQAAKGNGVYEDIYKAIYNLDPEDPTDEPTTEPTMAPSTEPTVQPNTDETKSTEETVKPTIKPQPATSSGSSTNSNASTTNSSVVQTGDISYALVLLTILAIAVCIVCFARKKKVD